VSLHRLDPLEPPQNARGTDSSIDVRKYANLPATHPVATGSACFKVFSRNQDP
jgi:hypothetical protein